LQAILLLIVIVCIKVLCQQWRLFGEPPLPTAQKYLRSDLIAACFYFENLNLIWRENDYFADFQKASVTRHIWTLAVEEQYYIAWPFLFMAVSGVAKMVTNASDSVPHSSAALQVSPPSPTQARNVVLCLTAFEVVAIGFSQVLGWHVYQTQGPSAAYYHTFTRAGDFAVGGLVACTIYLLPTSEVVRYQRSANLPPMSFQQRAMLEVGSAVNVLGISCGLVQLDKEEVLEMYFQWLRLPLAAITILSTIPQSLQATEPLPWWAFFTRFICSKALRFLGTTSVPHFPPLWYFAFCLDFLATSIHPS
jgi:peptidoglycan/LPS O-acetylase OafA/YrhL